MEEFLKSWYGIAALVAFDVVALLLVVCITYRWLFKRIFDFLISLLCLIVLSPLFVIVLVRGGRAKKRGEIERLLFYTPYMGKKEKLVFLSVFNSKNAQGETVKGYGEWLEKTGLYKLAYIWDIFLGKRSFIGVKPLTQGEYAFLEETEKDRQNAKTGLIDPLVLRGNKNTDYEEMLVSDKKYAWNFSFFGDCKIFFVWLLKMIRGEGNEYLGKTRERSYLRYLLDEGKITQAEYDAAL